MSKLSRIFARLLVSTTYGALLGSLVGWAYSLIVGYDGDHPYEYFIFASAMTGSLAMIGALTRVKTLIKFLCVSVVGQPHTFLNNQRDLDSDYV